MLFEPLMCSIESLRLTLCTFERFRAMRRDSIWVMNTHLSAPSLADLWIRRPKGQLEESISFDWAHPAVMHKAAPFSLSLKLGEPLEEPRFKASALRIESRLQEHTLRFKFFPEVNVPPLHRRLLKDPAETSARHPETTSQCASPPCPCVGRVLSSRHVLVQNDASLLKES